MEKRLFTSESVTEGHPDKVCDAISDAILDACMEQDKYSRVACETTACTGFVLVTGEITTKAQLDIPSIVRDTVLKIGYDSGDKGLDGNSCAVMVALDQQSADIAMGVDKALETREDEEAMLNTGAGDQGMMFGYASDETPELMPYPIMLAHKLAMKLTEVRKSKELKYLRPDGKSQVSVEYDENGKPKRIEAIVVSTQHSEDVTQERLHRDIKKFVIDEVVDKNMVDDNTKIYINPTGRFVIGGPHGDAGLTGRKIIVDTYGGYARHGGGAFCVDSDTEYLTKDGWKKINSYSGEEIAQWNDGILEFVKPYSYIDTECVGKMYRFLGHNSIDMVLSENHDMVLLTSKGNLIKKKVKYLLNSDGSIKSGHHGQVPMYFSFKEFNTNGINLSNDELRLQVAICADGSFVKDGTFNTRIRLVKDYKIERLRELLDRTGIVYDERNYSDGATYFYLDAPKYTKSLVESFKDCSYEQIKVVALELIRWDGNEDKMLYRTTVKEDADFAQFIMMATTDKAVYINTDDRVGELYGEDDKYVRNSILYTVSIKQSNTTDIRTSSTKSTCKSEEFIPSDNKMYCFTVPSGVLVLRRNNRVFITGNSGKDCTKVDRSAAYAARYVAKNIVAAGLAKKCEVQLSYAIGVATPTSIMVDTFGTGLLKDDELTEIVRKEFDLRPAGIIDMLDLRRPIYKQTASYGHFGRTDVELPWEKTNKIAALQKYL